jgi:hypothetical protein
MNKTIYLPDEEAETWEKARRLANDRLSPVLLKALKEYVTAREAETAGFERIQVEFEDSDDNQVPKIKAFHGKWIYSPLKPLETGSEGSTERNVYCVAVTAKGNIVVYTWRTEIETQGENPGYTYEFGYKFQVYSSFDEAARDRAVNYAIREAIKKRGVPVEELDI